MIIGKGVSSLDMTGPGLYYTLIQQSTELRVICFGVCGIRFGIFFNVALAQAFNTKMIIGLITILDFPRHSTQLSSIFNKHDSFRGIVKALYRESFGAASTRHYIST